jgi:DNA-binding MarR family transcriptional regulator
MIIDSNRIPADMAGSTLKGLCHLHEVGEARPTDLAKEVGFTTASATGLIVRAEEAGLVMRGRIPGDRRSSSIQLTKRGREFVEGLRPADDTVANREGVGA